MRQVVTNRSAASLMQWSKGMKMPHKAVYLAGIVTLTVMVLIAEPPASNAATRYIAQSAGVFSGGSACNGQTTIAAATFNALTNSPGDTNYICGTITGSASSNIITIKGSGTSSSPVNVIFDMGASLSAPYCNSGGNDSGCLVISTPQSPQSYITVNGGTPCGWTNTGGAEPACNGTIVNTASGDQLANTGASTNAVEMEDCTGCVVENLGIYNLYVESANGTTANVQADNCIIYSGTNNSIHDNRMHDVGWCLFYNMHNGDSNNQVHNNDVYNTPHPMFFATGSGATTTANNGYVYSNHFHDYANWNTPSCVFHVEGIHSSGPGAAPFPVFNDLYIYNNYFGPNEGNCLFSEIFFSVNTNTLGSAGYVNNSAIFNNIFEANASNISDNAMDITGNGNVVYNNTMVYDGSSSASVALAWSDISQNAGYTFSFKNNASQGFYTFVADDTSGSEGPGITGNYNVYASCADTLGGCLNAFVSGGTSTWTTYKANAFGQEVNSTPAGMGTGSKCCTGTLGLSASPAFIPQTGSVVVGAGTNLSSICSGQPNPGLGALCSDANGYSRPTTGAWAAGALQIGDSGAPTNGAGTPGGLSANAVTVQ
jgi:hypothetical protein